MMILNEIVFVLLTQNTEEEKASVQSSTKPTLTLMPREYIGLSRQKSENSYLTYKVQQRSPVGSTSLASFGQSSPKSGSSFTRKRPFRKSTTMLPLPSHKLQQLVSSENFKNLVEKHKENLTFTV